jgi:hypothetical protein
MALDMYTTAPLTLPAEISFVDSKNGLTIKKKWFEYGRLLQLIVAMIVNLGAGYALYELFYAKATGILLAGVIAIAMVVLIIQAIGLWMLYKGICGLCNTTVIKIDQSSISIHFKPLPWFGAKTIKRDDIVQFNVIEKDYSDAVINHVAYQLQVVVKNSDPVYLLKNLETPEQAQFIEERIEQFLFETKQELPKN